VVPAALALLAGCGGGDAPQPRATPTPTPTPTTTSTSSPRPARAPLPRPHCREGIPDCRSTSGRIVYVERVDPDGDGDLHVVVAGGHVTMPGITAIDVRNGLRPRRDPGIGDRAAAAGPVQTGSYGQSQIHALRFRVQR
jgi:hypothetical protein